MWRLRNHNRPWVDGEARRACSRSVGGLRQGARAQPRAPELGPVSHVPSSSAPMARKGSAASGLALLTPPPARSAELQHRAYMKALESRVQSMLVMPAAADQPDCVFVEDAAVCIGQKVCAHTVSPSHLPRGPPALAGPALLTTRVITCLRADTPFSTLPLRQVVLTQPGAPSRQAEVDDMARALKQLESSLAGAHSWTTARMQVCRGARRTAVFMCLRACERACVRASVRPSVLA